MICPSQDLQFVITLFGPNVTFVDLHPRSLTASFPLKMMLGRQAFPFGMATF